MNPPESLALEHDGIAQALARTFFWPGADVEDVAQEARIALLGAARSWRPDGPGSFPWYAYGVVRRRLIDLAFTRRDGKRLPRDTWSPLVFEDGEDCPYAPRTESLEDTVCRREELRAIVSASESLSELELCALGRVVRGEPISENSTGSKSLDNAYQRAKKRLRAAA